MVYTPEEKQRMDRLLKVFADYVANSMEIDIAYSDKSGYVRLIIDEGADTVFFRIDDFDDMLIMFMGDIFMDFAESELCLRAQSRKQGLLRAYEQLQSDLNTLDADREYAQNKLDKYYECMKGIYTIKDL